MPSWVDLATPDTDAARAFYGELFGWTFAEDETGETDYIMCSKNGHSAAGMMTLSEEMAASGMPPVWTSYVTVTNLDDAVGKVEGAGGTVMQGDIPVMEAGRMAVVADPAGAVICLWEAKEHIGCEVVNEHGALTWNELMTPDPAAVAPFYGEVFGWTAQVMPMPSGEYTVFFVEGGNEQGIAGAMVPPMEGMPPFWGVYFHVDDAVATVETARGLGAQVMMEATPMEGVGTLASMADPTGAMFSVMTPEG
ncbi:MAG: VOC family protein [Microthrixaceae bacterium]